MFIENISRIKTISTYTFYEIIKSKILVNIFAVGIFMLVITYISYQFSYGNATKVALDFGLGALSLTSCAIAIFFGANLMSKEIEQRTVHMILSRPISRVSFYLGKLIGLNLILILNILILSVMTLAIYFVYGGNLNSTIPYAILFIFFESSIVLSLVVFFTLVTTPTLSVILIIVIYFVGHAIGEVQNTTFVLNRPELSYVINIYSFFIPALYKLNLKDYVLYEQFLQKNFIKNGILYSIYYLMFLISLGSFIFKKKELN